VSWHALQPLGKISSVGNANGYVDGCCHVASCCAV
jgi:hypothetical protein